MPRAKGERRTDAKRIRSNNHTFHEREKTMPKKNCTLHDDIVMLKKYPRVNKYTLRMEYWTLIKPANKLNEAARTFLKTKLDPINSKSQYAIWNKKELGYLCKFYIGDVLNDLKSVVDTEGHRVFKVTLNEDAFAEKQKEVEEAILADMSALDVAMYRQMQSVKDHVVAVGDIVDFDEVDEADGDF